MLFSLIAAASIGAAAVASPIVREERAVTVFGAREVWRLEWTEPPKSYCQDEADALTCPCAGFAPGEIGKLVLVRTRRGKPEQRLELAQLFNGEEPGAIVKLRDPVMKVSPYGGAVFAFVLQIGNTYCGYQPSLLVGVERKRDELHAIGTAEAPREPLILGRIDSWAPLQKDGRVESVEQPCGDHGAETEVVATVTADAKGLHAQVTRYACAEDGKRGAPITPPSRP